MRKANNDERIIGKVNLWQGVIAAVVVLGILSVVLSLSYEMPILAVICGVVAVAILVLVIADPVGILRRKTRNDEADNQKE
jgi:ABC-type Fe3+-siderophore transport system permease subunit